MLISNIGGIITNLSDFIAHYLNLVYVIKLSDLCKAIAKFTF